MRAAIGPEVWFAAGVRTPFAKVDGPLGKFDALSLSVPVVRHMIERLGGAVPDFAVWGAVVPNLTWSNIAREVLMDAGVAPTIPAFSTIMACSTSMVAAWDRGFFDDLVIPIGDLRRDTIPRKDTSLEKLAKLPPSFDRTSGRGTLTAGNSSPLTDGAASLWVASQAGLARLPANIQKARLIDWEIASIDLRTEGLLMAPAFAIPRLLARNGLRYTDVDLWEIHEAFAAQVLFHIKALESADFVRNKAGVDAILGSFPRERVNPNGGSVALGHPFGATGARILSQAVKELAALPRGSRAVVSVCADGGLGTVALLEN